MLTTARRIVLLMAVALCAQGHVGSPDIFLQGSAGPYPMFVTIRPPTVIPGVAEIEIRCASPDVQDIHITPMPMTGEASKHPPTADEAHRSKQDLQFFTGSLWIMASGSWQVRVQASGAKGDGTLSVPVPAVASRTKPMQTAMAAGLFVMMLVLAFGLVSIVGAGAREAQLGSGAVPEPRSKARARFLMVATGAFVVFVLWAGDRWWGAEASGYAGYIYNPLTMSTTIGSGDKLTLKLNVTDWALRRNLDDFLPDHEHLMHLYVISQPDASHVWHLHPEFATTGTFVQALPAMPAGKYKLYGDVVHRSGFAETIVAELDLPQAIVGNPLLGDDAAGVRGESPDGAHIVWERDAEPLVAKKAQTFRFKLVDKDGQPVNDEEFYMGMLGHAAFVKDDATVFAHVHPSGSVPMAALAIANPAGEQHDMHQMDAKLPAEADFPYGFPTPGRYHVIVQMKHGGVIETGVFDTVVQ